MFFSLTILIPFLFWLSKLCHSSLLLPMTSTTISQLHCNDVAFMSVMASQITIFRLFVLQLVHVDKKETIIGPHYWSMTGGLHRAQQCEKRFYVTMKTIHPICHSFHAWKPTRPEAYMCCDKHVYSMSRKLWAWFAVLFPGAIVTRTDSRQWVHRS